MKAVRVWSANDRIFRGRPYSENRPYNLRVTGWFLTSHHFLFTQRKVVILNAAIIIKYIKPQTDFIFITPSRAEIRYSWVSLWPLTKALSVYEFTIISISRLNWLWIHWLLRLIIMNPKPVSRIDLCEFTLFSFTIFLADELIIYFAISL